MDILRQVETAVRSFFRTPTPAPFAGRWTAWLLVVVMAALAVLPVEAMLATAVVPEDSVALTAAAAVVVGAALAARRPLPGWALGGVAVVLLSATTAPDIGAGAYDVNWVWWAWWPALVVVAWSVTGRRLQVVWVVSFLLTVMQQTLTAWGDGWVGVPISLLLTAAPLGVGTWIRSRRRARDDVAAERERTVQAREAGVALAERARIAREMHDVVAHHMSLIAVRAETAPYRLPDLDPRAAAELAEVAAAARSAMGDMQQLLGVLRSDDTMDTRPQPGVPDIEPLLASAREAGTVLTWRLADVAVPAAVGLTVYRVVAQGLANAGQHAAGAPVDVGIETVEEGLRVVVRSGPGHDHGSGSGAGIVGLSERVAMHGGRLHTRPTEEGGFELEATIPVRQTAAHRG